MSVVGVIIGDLIVLAIVVPVAYAMGFRIIHKGDRNV